MRHFLTASICLAMIFAAFGCADKKGQKGSLRTRGASAKGTVAPIKPGDAKIGTNKEDDKKIADAAKDATPKNCSVDPLKELAGTDEVEIDGFTSLVNDQDDSEYILTEAAYYYAQEDGSKFPGQALVRSSGFVKETEATAITEADEKTTIICENSVTEKNKPLKVDAGVDLINRFSTKDGSYLALRNIDFSATGSIAEVKNKFDPIAMTVAVAERDLEGKSKADLIAKAGTVTKDKDGNIYWRVSTRVAGKQKGIYDVNSIVAKYEKRTKATSAPAATTAAVTKTNGPQ